MNTLKKSFTLTNASQIYSMPFSDALQAALVEKFERIQALTPSKIDVDELRRVVDRSSPYLYKRNRNADFATISSIGGATSQTVKIRYAGCIGDYVAVEWTLVIEDGRADFRPGLERNDASEQHKLDYDFLYHVDSDLRKTRASVDGTIVELEDHPNLSHALAGEVEEIMRDLILTLASEHGLEHMVAEEGEKVVDEGTVPVSTADMRDLLAAAGYSAKNYKLPERQLLDLAGSVLTVEQEG